MKTTTILVLVGGLLALTGCTNQKESTVNDANQTSSKIETKVGEKFTITLPANLTTGYSWRIDEIKPAIVRKDDYKYNQSANARGLVGVGGEEVWTFEAVSKGRVIIHLEYVRPWEVDVPPVKKADFTIIVTK